MAEWKKILYSGSAAEVSSISVDGAVTAGSFSGDGSGLTNVTGLVPDPFTIGGPPEDPNNIAGVMSYGKGVDSPANSYEEAHNIFIENRLRTDNTYGGSIAFGGVNGGTGEANRAHTAIAQKRSPTGGDEDRTGLAFFTHDSTTSTTPMQETMYIDRFEGLTISNGNGSSSLMPQSSGDLKITTDYGYCRVGPANENWCHFQTDMPKFYFNKAIHVNGQIHSYNQDLVLQRFNDDTDTTPTEIKLTNTTINWYIASGHEMQLQSDGDLHVEGDVIAYSSTISDRKLKDDINTIPNALSKIHALRGVSYTWNAGSRSGQPDIGLIAQEVEKVIPEIVRPKKMPLLDDKEYKTIDYEKIIAVLVESVKELSDKVNHLQEQVDNA